jgi:pyruvate,water dikinase
MKFIKWLRELSRKDVASAGGKGANLAEMYNIGLPVPDAFVVTAQAFQYFLEKNQLNVAIFDVLKNTDVNNSLQLQNNTKKIREMILQTKIPKEIIEEIIEAYKKLSKKFDKKNESVVVRSSATAEDLPEASFAGQQLTVMNVVGKEEVVEAVKKCWASLFTARATFYRESKGFEHHKVLIAVPVQKQVDSEKAGVGFTIHPSTGEKNKILIEASWGQGESVVSGSVTPDTYIIDKETGEVIQRDINRKTQMRILDKSKGGLKEVDVPHDKQVIECLTDDELKQLYELSIKLGKHYNMPQDFEWVTEGGEVFLVQTRPVTVLYEEGILRTRGKIGIEPILKGLSACPGVASGVVNIVDDSSDLDKIQKGDILVTKMTNPDFVPAMKRATAIVTDEGGQTSHAAIVSRELGVVCVVGTKEATEKLKDGDVITVNGSEGLIYPGKVKIEVEEKKEYKFVETKTKIYMNLGEPDLAEKYKNLKIDGIGLFRAEFMAAELGKHPKLLIEEGGSEKMVNKFAEGIKKVAKTFYPRPIVYRALDFKTNEYAGLKGGDRFEQKEANPMIGWRGASRYITEPEVFELELRAIKKVRDEGFDNVWLMIPFVRTTWELKEIRKIIEIFDLTKDRKFKLWIMVEVPSSAILIEDFIKEGIDGVSIGSNDLTQLVLGVDRDSATLGERWFYELDPAVLWCIEKVVKTCKKHKITSSICGQAPSFYPELTRKLIKWGITSVSVNPDVVDKTRYIVAECEGKL